MNALLSNDLRLRVVSSIDLGLSRRAAAAKFDVCIASIIRWYQRDIQTGSAEPASIGGDSKAIEQRRMLIGLLAGLMNNAT